MKSKSSRVTVTSTSSNKEYFIKPTGLNVAKESWWIGLSREAFSCHVRQNEPRMRGWS